MWFRNVYGSNGIRANSSIAAGEAVPDFTLDPENQPTACAEPSPTTFPPVYFDPDFRFPQTLKVALGADRLLPGGIVGTVDFLYTRGVSTVQLMDVNLAGPIGTAAGEGGRAMYGTIDPATGRGDTDSAFRRDAAEPTSSGTEAAAIAPTRSPPSWGSAFPAAPS